jgi:hypothetical protein
MKGGRQVNEEGGKEDMKGKNTREKGNFGGSIIFYIGRVFGFFFGGLEDCISGFWLEELVGVWWTVTGEHLLLGVLGSGARNPYGILLGSQIGSVPSWLGGKIQFWAEFGRAAWAQFQLQLG